MARTVYFSFQEYPFDHIDELDPDKIAKIKNSWMIWEERMMRAACESYLEKNYPKHSFEISIQHKK
jgi:hypothetical protein